MHDIWCSGSRLRRSAQLCNTDQPSGLDRLLSVNDSRSDNVRLLLVPPERDGNSLQYAVTL